MSDSSSIDVLVRGAHALARERDSSSILDGLLSGIAGVAEADSGAIFVPAGAAGELAIVASLGFGADTAAGLTAAVRNPVHAVARTFASGETGYDVLPGAPGGPALRTHLPLVVGRDGTEHVVGVLALAHDRPIDPGLRPMLAAAADLAALAIDRGGAG